MALSIDDIRHVAKLARLEMAEAELERMLPHLNILLERFRSLQDVDTDGVEPTAHALPLLNVLREDEIEPSLSRDAFLSQAPDAADGMFVVPRIVEDDA